MVRVSSKEMKFIVFWFLLMNDFIGILPFIFIIIIVIVIVIISILSSSPGCEE